MTRSGVETRGDARREVLGAGLLVASLILFVIEPLHGPVLLSLSGSHGLDVGDLVALPFLAGGALLLAGSPAHQQLLRAAARIGGDLTGAASWALIVTGTSFMLVLLVDQSSLPDVVPHAGAPLLLLSLLSVAVLAVLLFDPTTCDDVFGASLWLVILMLLAGFAVDLTHPEAGSVMGPTLLAALFFVTLGQRARAARWTMAALIVVFVSWDLVALVDPRTFELEREAGGGGLGRVGALGLLMCSVGILARSSHPTLQRRREP